MLSGKYECMPHGWPQPVPVSCSAIPSLWSRKCLPISLCYKPCWESLCSSGTPLGKGLLTEAKKEEKRGESEAFHVAWKSIGFPNWRFYAHNFSLIILSGVAGDLCLL